MAVVERTFSTSQHIANVEGTMAAEGTMTADGSTATVVPLVNLRVSKLHALDGMTLGSQSLLES